MNQPESTSAVEVPSSSTRSIVFVDSSIENRETFTSSVIPNTQIVTLDRSRDGVEQITEVLSQHRDLEAVHIVSHGGEGSLQLGSSQLNTESLNTYDDELQQWRSALTEHADLVLYGCNIASGNAGIHFLEQLSQQTGADIAASDDLTGNATLGGDGVLEVEIGSIEAPLAFSTETLETYSSLLAEFEVSSFEELQAAIETANDNGEDDSIAFLSNITLEAELPIIESTIDFIGNDRTISGANSFRVFFVRDATVNFSDLTIANGRARGGNGGDGGSGGGGAAGVGGGLFLLGSTATLNNVTFSNNHAIGGNGGRGLGSPFGAGGGGGIGGDGGDGSAEGFGGGGGGTGGPGSDATATQGGDGGDGGIFGGVGGMGGVNSSGEDGIDGGGGGGGGVGSSNPTAGGVAENFGAGGGGFGNGGGGSGASGGILGGTGGASSSSERLGEGLGDGGGREFSGKGIVTATTTNTTFGGGGGAGLGGAVLVLRSSLTALDVSFENNSAEGGRGGSGLDIDGTDGQGKGGALFIIGSSTVTGGDLEFSGNSASDDEDSETDNDDVFGEIEPIEPQVIVTESDGNTAVTEDGEIDTYEIALTTTPTGSIEITATADDQSLISVDGVVFDTTQTLTFSDRTPQTVTVRAIDDPIVENDHQSSIEHNITASNDPNFLVNLSLESVIASIADNDTVGVTITESNDSTEVAEGGFTDSYRIALNTPPREPVVILITADEQTILSFDGENFAPILELWAFDTSDTVITVQAIDDLAVEGNHTSTLSHQITSGDLDYFLSVEIPDLEVSVIDNDSVRCSFDLDRPDLSALNLFDGLNGEFEDEFESESDGELDGEFESEFDSEFESNFEIGRSIVGTDGTDTLIGGTEPLDDVQLGEGNTDFVNGNRGNDRISGGDSDDWVRGGKNDDFVFGDAGNDLVFGDLGNDTIDGGEGNDTVIGSNGIPNTEENPDGGDWMQGGSGDDFLDGNSGNDTVFGDEGTDTVRGGKNDDLVFGDLGDDWVFGDAGNDTMLGSEGNDILVGGNGNPLSAEDGNDLMCGGEGNDLVFGNRGNDELGGSVGDDTLLGGQEGDKIEGGAGDDVIAGDWGDDTLTGGEGSDRFFLISGHGIDFITDFEDGVDSIVFPADFDCEIEVSQIETLTILVCPAGEGEVLAILNNVEASSISDEDFLFV